MLKRNDNSNDFPFDPELIDWESQSFSFRNLREAVYDYCQSGSTRRRFREANAETSFGMLLRAGIQQFALGAYQIVPVVYPDVVTENQSQRRQEFYAPMYRPNMPIRVEQGQKFQGAEMQVLDREVVNQKFGRVETFERELFDDDQTGQIKQRASQMGENFKILEEIYVGGKLTGSGYTVQGVTVDTSTLNNLPATHPQFGVFTTAKGNRPAAFVRLSQINLENADISLMGITDPLGNQFLVTPTTLVVSRIDKFIAAKLLNSALQPSVPSATADTTGYTMTMNPLQGLYKLLVHRFIPQKSWTLGDHKRALVFQRRDPLEIIQEHPASGDSFSQDAYKFRSRSRFEVEWIDSRFVFQGDDGSV